MLQRALFIQRFAPGLAALAIAMLPPSSGLHGQTVQGMVIDATTSAPIPNAEINVTRIDEWGGRTRSDSLGTFVLRLPKSGAYRIQASALGYARSASASIDLSSDTESVEVLLRLSPEPIAIEGLTVLSRGLELRHRATFLGFQVRHADALRVGLARVVSKDDPEMRNAFDVADVLQWFPTGKNTGRRACLVVYVDGKVLPGSPELENIPVLDLEGIEFYADPLDAPLELRSRGPRCATAGRFSVLAIWRSRPSGKE